MKDLFVPYELAVKLKEKGMKFHSLGCYIKNKTTGNISLRHSSLGYDRKNNEAINAPLWQQATDWLREEKGIEVYVCVDHNNDLCWVVVNGEKYVAGDYYPVLESGILKAIDLI